MISEEEKLKNVKKTLSWYDPGATPGLRGERPAAKHGQCDCQGISKPSACETRGSYSSQGLHVGQLSLNAVLTCRKMEAVCSSETSASNLQVHAGLTDLKTNTDTIIFFPLRGGRKSPTGHQQLQNTPVMTDL
jgi:hypothetical protein